MVEIKNAENNALQNAHRSNFDSEFELKLFAREAVDQLIKNCFAQLTKQLEELSRLVYGI